MQKTGFCGKLDFVKRTFINLEADCDFFSMELTILLLIIPNSHDIGQNIVCRWICYLLWDRRLLQSGILKYFQKDECVKKVYIENGREWILEIQYTFFCTLSTEIQ